MKKLHNWTLEEDKLLIQLYHEAECFQRWKFISNKFHQKGYSKTEFQCRERYTNHIDPSLKHGKLNTSEIKKLFACYDQYGPRWSLFESKISGRSQNLLKNKFYSTLRSLIRQFLCFDSLKNTNGQKMSPSSLSSRLLTDLYEGKKYFSKYRKMLRNCLKFLNYTIGDDAFRTYLLTLEPGMAESFKQDLQGHFDEYYRKKRGKNYQPSHEEPQQKLPNQNQVMNSEEKLNLSMKEEKNCQKVFTEINFLPINYAFHNFPLGPPEMQISLWNGVCVPWSTQMAYYVDQTPQYSSYPPEQI